MASDGGDDHLGKNEDSLSSPETQDPRCQKRPDRGAGNAPQCKPDPARGKTPTANATGLSRTLLRVRLPRGQAGSAPAQQSRPCDAVREPMRCSLAARSAWWNPPAFGRAPSLHTRAGHLLRTQGPYLHGVDLAFNLLIFRQSPLQALFGVELGVSTLIYVSGNVKRLGQHSRG